MAKILKNTTGSDISLDSSGLYIVSSSSLLLEVTDYSLIAADDSVSELTTLISSGDIVVNDGSADLSVTEAIAFIQYPDQALSVRYDNSSSLLSATETQGAIDQVKGILDALPDSLPVLQARFPTTLTVLPGTFASIPLNIVDVNTQSDVIDINPGDTTEVRLKEDGVYQCTYTTTVRGVSNPDSARMRAVANGAAIEIPGSYDDTGDQEAGNGGSSLEIGNGLNRTFLYSATANDTIEIQWETDSAHTNITSVTFVAVKMDAQFANFVFSSDSDTSRATLKSGGVSELVSGVNQAVVGTATTIINWNDQDLFDSSCFSHTSGDSEIVLDKPGRYRISSKVNVQRTANGRVAPNAFWQSSTGGGGFIDIDKSYSHAYTRSSDAVNFGSCAATFTYNAIAGDKLRCGVSANEAAAQCNILGARTNFVIEYIGENP